MAFVPTQFATPLVAPSTFQAYDAAPYLAISDYRFAPTAVGTQQLVQNAANPTAASDASLAQVILRASDWINTYCYHDGGGSFVASVAVEQDMLTVKPDGSIVLICNYRPIRELTGLALGATPSSVQSLTTTLGLNVFIGEKTITLMGGFQGSAPQSYYGPWPSWNGQVCAVYSYVAGWPHTTLAQDAHAGDTVLHVNSPVQGANRLYGAYANTPLTIQDDSVTESVTLASTPTGLTLSLASPLKYDHLVPQAPDTTIVSALPNDVQQACIAAVNVLIKTQGMRAQVLPGSIGGPSVNQQQALSRAGAMGDWELAESLLKPYVQAYYH